MAVQAVAASSVVNQVVVSKPGLAGVGKGLFNAVPGTAAGVGALFGDEFIQCALIENGALRLVHRLGVRHQTEVIELRQNHLVCTRQATRRVYIFNTHQPLPAPCASIKPTSQCCDQGAGVERAGRGGGKAPPVAGSSHVVSAQYQQFFI